MKKFFKLFLSWFNNLQLRIKIICLFLFCVIMPLTITDGMILSRIVAIEEADEKYEAEETVVAIQDLMADVLENCEKISTSISLNRNVEEFLGEKYDNSYDYFAKYYMMTDNSYFQTLVGFSETKVKIYSNNPSMKNGGYVGRISSLNDKEWYKEFASSGLKRTLVTFFDASDGYYSPNRKIVYLSKLSYPNNKYDQFVYVENDYRAIGNALKNVAYDGEVLLCHDGKVIVSSSGNNNIGQDFGKLSIKRRDIMCTKTVYAYNEPFEIYVMRNDSNAINYLNNNRGVICLLILFNIMLPGVFMILLNYSIVHRINKLERVFSNEDNAELAIIEHPDGNDEIGKLMLDYNRMAERINELIQIVYKDRLKEQEMDIARQNAELLALHSQINPHFMFNALESIRMHSLLKNETETADMVEKLALMERQYVDWGSDMIAIYKEMFSVEAYLGLQKYRFGSRLEYEIDVEEECKNILIPKLTIVTFVENACVHGMESKSGNCFVFVRVYQKDKNVVIEVEDTGNGIDEETLNEITDNAQNLDIDGLKEKKHVGIYNALLRLKMITGDCSAFSMESEEGIGTIVTITFPVEGKI